MNDHRFTHWPIYERIGEKIPRGMKIQGIILYYESLKTWQCFKQSFGLFKAHCYSAASRKEQLREHIV